MGPAQPVALVALAAAGAGAGARAAPPPPAAERAGRERPRTPEPHRGGKRLRPKWKNISGLGVLRRVVPVQGRHLLAGAVAGAASRSALAPLERVKLELQLHQRPGGAAGVLRGIVRREVRPAPHLVRSPPGIRRLAVGRVPPPPARNLLFLPRGLVRSVG